MKKIIVTIILVVFNYYLYAQTITKEEIECIDALILAKTPGSMCKTDVDNYTLFNCFSDSSIFKNKNGIINQLKLIKTNDNLKNQFYGRLNYYYSGYKKVLAEKLNVYRDDSLGFTQIISEHSLNLFIQKITSSSYNHDEELYRITDTTKDKSNLYDTIIEENAIYPGGDVELYNFIRNRIIYPTYERDADISGNILVQFIVEKNGMISDVKCVKKISPGLDCEAMRVIKLMPNWIPAKNNGKPIRLFYNIPINFELQ